MRFFCPYGINNEFVEVFIEPVNKKDITNIKQWIKFDRQENINFQYPSERTNFLAWDIAINNIGTYDGEVYKVTSIITGTERLEGLLHLEITQSDEVIIEALEIAPWNRELYLGNNRHFKKMGLILIAYTILYGIKHNSCGTIRLESLEVRENYYRNTLLMTELKSGVFIYDQEDCREFLDQLIHKGFLLP